MHFVINLMNRPIQYNWISYCNCLLLLG